MARPNSYEPKLEPPPGSRLSVCSSPSFWNTPTQSCGNGQQLDAMKSPNRLQPDPILPGHANETGVTPTHHSPNTEHMNTQTHTNRPARFSGWVTFDDDDDKPNIHHCWNTPGSAPSPVTKGNVPILPPPSLALLQLSPAKEEVTTSRKNPFHDESLSNLQPSPINPFSAYFSSSPSPVSPISGSNDSANATDGINSFLQISEPGVSLTPVEDTPFLPSHMAPCNGWPLMLRIPEKKNIMSSRHWGPIYVQLDCSGLLRFFYEKGLDKPFKELQLDGRHEASEHRLQGHEEGASGAVHTLSIDLLLYKEKRRMQPRREQLVKLGTVHYGDFLSFSYALRNLLPCLPAQPDPASILAEEEVQMQVEVQDEFTGTVARRGMLKYLVETRVYVVSFGGGTLACRLALNLAQGDREGQEAVPRGDIVPHTCERWVEPHDWQLHDCVDEPEFSRTGMLAFVPPLARRLQVLRFRAPFAETAPPVSIRTVASIRGAEVELQSWLILSSSFSPNSDPMSALPCENVVVRYPVPGDWAKNFRRDNVIGERTRKPRINRGCSVVEPTLRVSLGTAKYEHAFRAVVWKMNMLPDKNTAVGQPHSFFCRLELGSDWEVPTWFQRHVEVEFDMPAASASKTCVRSLSVEDRSEVKKWITYSSHYMYQVEMDLKSDSTWDSSPEDQPGVCSQQ